MSKRITITVPKNSDDSTRVEVDGVTGSSCQDLTQHLETALGHSNQVDVKDAFHQQEQQNEQQNELGGGT